MGRDIVERLVAEVAFIHGSFLEVVEGLDEDRFKARPGTKAPAIAFHLWHTARWADAFQARFASLAPHTQGAAGRAQIWDERDLGTAWGLGDALGKDATGAGLDDDASAALSLPRREQVETYAGAAFAAAEEVFGRIDDGELFLPTGDFYDEGDWIVLDHFSWHLTHASRHLGMAEALKGVLGLEGTATT